MKDFKFNPLDASRIMESLHLLSDAGIPYVKVYNLKYLVVPKAMRYIPMFKRVVFKEQDLLENTPSDLLTLEDFKNFEIVRARDTQLGVKTAESGELLGLEITAYRYGTGYLLGKWGTSAKSPFWKVYENLVSMLPAPVSEVNGTRFDDFYTPLFTVITSATATLSFLYFLYTFDAMKVNHRYTVKVEGIVETHPDAIGKLKKITETLKKLGNDFNAVLGNLRLASYLLG
jgi:hypothetical protein